MYAVIACRITYLYRIVIVHQPFIPSAIINSDVIIAVLIQNQERRACSPACSAVECKEVVECKVAVSPDFLEPCKILDSTVFIEELRNIKRSVCALAPDSAFRLTGFVHIAVSACLSEPLIFGTNADELKVVIIGNFVLSILDRYPVLRVCRYICAKVFCCLFCFRSLCVELVACICPCSLASIEDLDIFNTAPDVAISLTSDSAWIVPVQNDLGILADSVSKQVISYSIRAEKVVSALSITCCILYLLDRYINSSRKMSRIVVVARICRVCYFCDYIILVTSLIAVNYTLDPVRCNIDSSLIHCFCRYRFSALFRSCFLT